MTGVSVILCADGARAAAEIRGSATGTRQFDSLVKDQHLATRCHAVVLSGGSGAGLSSADPVVESLRAQGKGFNAGVDVVPLVPTAILFDLGFGGSTAAPTRQTVEAALGSASSGPVASGSVGVGTGATVGKALGLEGAMKGGVGFAAIRLEDGLEVAALVAVNAFGDVRDPGNGRLIAGCRESAESRTLIGADRVLARRRPEAGHAWEGNTTLAVVMTNADLPKVALRKVCEMAFGGFHRALCPALTLYDGDLIVVLSMGEQEAHVHQVGVLGERVVAEAIVTAVREADGFGLVPAVRDVGSE